MPHISTQTFLKMFAKNLPEAASIVCALGGYILEVWSSKNVVISISCTENRTGFVRISKIDDEKYDVSCSISSAPENKLSCLRKWINPIQNFEVILAFKIHVTYQGLRDGIRRELPHFPCQRKNVRGALQLAFSCAAAICGSRLINARHVLINACELQFRGRHQKLMVYLKKSSAVSILNGTLLREVQYPEQIFFCERWSGNTTFTQVLIISFTLVKSSLNHPLFKTQGPLSNRLQWIL